VYRQTGLKSYCFIVHTKMKPINQELDFKFKRIVEKTPRANLEKLDIVFEDIKNREIKRKNPSTISDITKSTKLKANTIKNYIGHLEKSEYIKRGSRYPFVYIKTTLRVGDVEFIHGKENRDQKIEYEKNRVLTAINTSRLDLPQELQKIQKLVTTNKKFDYLHYNRLVEFLWNKSKDNSFVKLDIGSGANRFSIYKE